MNQQSSTPRYDGTIYSSRQNLRPFRSHAPEEYLPLIGEEKLHRLLQIGERLKGMNILDLNATARGGGVAEMLYSSVPFLDALGLQTEWKTVGMKKEYFQCTKEIHNLLQGKPGKLTPDMKKTYFDTLTECATAKLIDYEPDAVVVHDPQPLGLTRYLRKSGKVWIWRCHIDIENMALIGNTGLRQFLDLWISNYDAAIFSAAHYVVSQWPVPKFIIPPFIDPLSEKNREMSEVEINAVLQKYEIDPGLPIVAQISRFDPWKGLDRTINTYRELKKQTKCQLVMAGGLASDDPEGEQMLAKICFDTKDDEDVHVLNLSLDDRLENYREVNALQRAASLIMHPAAREGFGLVITEALWKSKPVIAANVGAIPLQIRDGDTGFFFESPEETAKIAVYLLENPEAARLMGERGRSYVADHFLLPDRILDYLRCIEMTIKTRSEAVIPEEAIISFHPWFKLAKRPSAYVQTKQSAGS